MPKRSWRSVHMVSGRGGGNLETTDPPAAAGADGIKGRQQTRQNLPARKSAMASLDLLGRVHHERAVPRDGFVSGSPATSSRRAACSPPVSCSCSPSDSTPSSPALQLLAADQRRLAGEHVGEAVMRRGQVQRQRRARLQSDVQVDRRGGDTLDRTRRARQLAGDDAYLDAVGRTHHGNPVRADVLVARRASSCPSPAGSPTAGSPTSGRLPARGISECRMPRPAVIHCTLPGVRSPLLPWLSRWRMCPASM